MLRLRRASATVLVATAIATLSACGGNDSSAQAPPTTAELTGSDLVAVCSNSGYADAYPEQCAGVVTPADHMDTYKVSIDAFNDSPGATIARTSRFMAPSAARSRAPRTLPSPTLF